VPRGFYTWAVTALGLLAVAHAAAAVLASPPDHRWLVLSAFAFIGAVATLKMQAAPASFSISDTFTFVVLLLFGPAPAILTPRSTR
jgi:hypothetical protein